LKAKTFFKKNHFSVAESKKLLKILNPAVKNKKIFFFSAVELIKKFKKWIKILTKKVRF